MLLCHEVCHYKQEGILTNVRSVFKVTTQEKQQNDTFYFQKSNGTSVKNTTGYSPKMNIKAF